MHPLISKQVREIVAERRYSLLSTNQVTFAHLRPIWNNVIVYFSAIVQQLTVTERILRESA